MNATEAIAAGTVWGVVRMRCEVKAGSVVGTVGDQFVFIPRCDNPGEPEAAEIISPIFVHRTEIEALEFAIPHIQDRVERFRRLTGEAEQQLSDYNNRLQSLAVETLEEFGAGILPPSDERLPTIAEELENIL